MSLPYQEMSPTSKHTMDSKLKILFDIIQKKHGRMQPDDDDITIVKATFREFPIFKDIPPHFRLEFVNLRSGQTTIVNDTPKPQGQSHAFSFDQELAMNQARQKRMTVAMPRESISMLSKHLSQELPSISPKQAHQMPSSTNVLGDEQTILMENIKKSDEVKVVYPLDYFGQSYSLTGAKWRPSFVVATTDNTLVFRVLISKIDSILNKINSSEQHKQLLNFLSQTISGFDRISAVARDKIARSFVERQFFPGQKLLREGEVHNHAFIIKEGDCQLVSKINPCDIKFNKDGNLIVKDKNLVGQYVNDKRKRGYMSRTTNSFQFGIKGKNQWVGEDILILQPNEPLYFSVVAVGKVTCIEIQKMDMLSKLPFQFVKFLEKSSLKRKEFLKDRMMNINKTIKTVVKQGEEKQIFDNEDDRKQFQHHKSLLIQQQIRMLSDQEALEKKKYKKIQQKNTIYLKIKDDVTLEEEMTKTQNQMNISLPMIANPRDSVLQLNLQYPSDVQEGNNFSINNLKTVSRGNSPLKNRLNESSQQLQSQALLPQQQYQTPQQVQHSILQKLNTQIEQKHYKQYIEEANKTTQQVITKSDIGNVRQSGYQLSEYTLNDGKNQQSYANLSIMDQSEIGENQSLIINVKSRDINTDNKGERKGLLNATTLKPYAKYLKVKELVPIFYQRDPKKTRNMIANSMQAIKLVNDYEEKQSIKAMTVLNDGQSYIDDGTSHFQSFINNYPKAKLDYTNASKTYQTGGERTQLSKDESEYALNQYQSNALQPQLYEFSVPGGSSSVGPSSRMTKSVQRVADQLKKEAKLKYGYFNLGSKKINELEPRIVQGYKQNKSSLGVYSIDHDENAESRKGTPNPWEQHKKRIARKQLLSYGIHIKESEPARSQLSYLNYDI